jgi:hypothetical protein
MTKRRLLLAILPILVLLGAVGGWAYWTTTGSGTASASNGTLTAPGKPSVPTTAGTVNLSWSDATVSGGGTVKYHVERRNDPGSTWTDVCGSTDAAPITATSCSNTPGNGTFVYRVTSRYASWHTASPESDPVAVNGDTTVPYVVSVNRVGTSPTNAGTVDWAVTFSESVTGVDTPDFTLARTGVTGGSVTSVTGSGATRTVTGSTGSGDGSVGLNLVDDDTIQDGAGNPLGTSGGAGSGNFTGQTYAIDKTVPVVTITQVNGAVRTFPYSTSANVTSLAGSCGAASGDLAPVTVTVDGLATNPASATCSSGAWTLTLSVAISAEASHSVVVSQSDQATNAGTDTKTVKIDRTPPTNVLSLANQSTQSGPASTTNSSSFLSGNTLWYAGGVAGNFKLQNALTDSLSGPASSTFAALGGFTSGWTFTGSTVSTPSGGPYVSNQLSWTSGTASVATEGVTGTDAAGNTNTASALTFRGDSFAPTDTITFPATNGSYNDPAWDASPCAAGEICGTASDPGSTGASPPSFGTQSSVANSSSGATTLVITAPSSVATGDVLIAGVTVSAGSGASITAPSGWTLISRLNSSNNVSVASYYHVVTNGGSEPSSYTWTFDSSLTASGGILRYVGVDTTDPIDASTAGAGNSSSPTAPSVTTTSANELVVALFGSDSTGTFTPPSGMTERYDVHNTIGPAAPATEAADVTQASAGATGAKTATATVSARWVAQLIALNPAPPNISGLAKLQVSIQATSGANINKYWDPAANAGAGGFTSATEVLMLASGTSTWSLAFPSTNFSDAKYTVKAYAVDNVGNYTTTPASATNVTIDNAGPAVTINQASGQSDPTNASTINFTVVFGESVTGFATGDVTLTGTAGATTATVTGSGTTYNVAVTGMTTSGTVIATVGAAKATDVAGNGNTASTSTDNTVSYDVAAPTVTINQAAGQSDPTNASPINFTVLFSESVAGFATGDVTLAGTAGATTATVTGSGTTYNVAVTGMTTAGTVSATIAAGAATDAAGNGNFASTSTDNTVSYDATPPTVTVNQKSGQADPTNALPILFTVTFSEPVTGFATGDLTRGGTATGGTVSISGIGASYEISVSGGNPSNGTISFTIAAGVAQDATGNNNTASTSTDNTVTYDTVAPPLTTLDMLDADANGTVDQVKATFNEALDSTSYTPTNAPWTVNNVPSSGTKGAVTISGSTATLVITEGTGAENTAVGSFSVALAASSVGVRDAAGNQASFSSRAPTDKAAPVAIALVDTNGAADGLFAQTDTMTVTFSENVIGVPASSTVSLVGGNGGGGDDLLSMSSLFGSGSLGRSDYISGNGSTATFSSAVSQPTAGQIKVTLGACAGACGSLTTASAAGLYVLTPLSTITDAAGNTAVGNTFTIRLF